jgi:hypothetical protein
LSNNSCILWNSSSSINIVTSAHDNLNTCCLNLNDWINNGISEWILDTKDTNSNQIFFKAISIIFFLKIIVSLFELLKFTQWHIFIANQNCSISLICIILNSCPKDIFMSWLSSTSLLYNIIKWYKAFWILAITSPRFFSSWNSSFSYHVEKYIWCSLSVYSDISIILLNDYWASLCFWIKWNNTQNLIFFKWKFGFSNLFNTHKSSKELENTNFSNITLILELRFGYTSITFFLCWNFNSSITIPDWAFW